MKINFVVAVVCIGCNNNVLLIFPKLPHKIVQRLLRRVFWGNMEKHKVVDYSWLMSRVSALAQLVFTG